MFQEVKERVNYVNHNKLINTVIVQPQVNCQVIDKNYINLNLPLFQTNLYNNQNYKKYYLKLDKKIVKIMSKKNHNNYNKNQQI